MATPRKHRKRTPREDNKFDAFLRFRKAHSDGTLYKAVPYKNEQGKEINPHHFHRFAFDQAGFDVNTLNNYLGKGYQLVEVYMNDRFKRKYGRGSVDTFDQDGPSSPVFQAVLKAVPQALAFGRQNYDRDIKDYQPGDEDYDINQPYDEDIAFRTERLKSETHKEMKKQQDAALQKKAEKTAGGASA